MKHVLILMTTILISHSAMACGEALLKLNEEVSLTGRGIANTHTPSVKVKDLIKSPGVGERIEIKDQSQHVTHVVILLGVVSDTSDVMSSSYLVKDVKTGISRVYLMRTNYHGNGLYSRGMDAPDQAGAPSNDSEIFTKMGC